MRVCPNCEFETEEDFCPKDHYPTIDKSLFGQSEDGMEGLLLVGKYRIIRKLGAGGCGAVYQAHQLDMDRMVAIKVMLKNLSSDINLVKRFYREVRTSSKLEHPNTINIYDFGHTKDGTLYYAMQYLEGEPLAHVVQREAPLLEVRVNYIATQICKSLAEAHDLGIIHRDLKPENVFMSEIRGEEDHVKVLDFGIAKLVHGDEREGTLTTAGQTFGTPKYMSPEQARSKPLDARSDLYALGVMMYEMLGGVPPFQAEDTLGILMMHVQKPPPPITDHLPISPEMRALVMQLLEKQPQARPANADEVLARLGAMPSATATGPQRRYPSGSHLPEAVEYMSDLETGPTLARTPSGPFSGDQPAVGQGPTGPEALPSPDRHPGVEGAMPAFTPTGAVPPVPAVARQPSKRTLILAGVAAALLVLALTTFLIIMAPSESEGPADQGKQSASLTGEKKPESEEPAADTTDAGTVVTHAPSEGATAEKTVVVTHPPSGDTTAEKTVVVTHESVSVAKVDAKTTAGTEAALSSAETKKLRPSDTADAGPTSPPAKAEEDVLLLQTAPPGATVELDGKAVGKTPHRYRWRKGETERRFVLSLSGHEPVAVKLRREAGEHTRQVALQRVAETRIETKPSGATVMLGRRQLGKTPYVHQWGSRAEMVELRLGRRGYQTRRVKLTKHEHSGKTLNLSLKKKATTKRLCRGGICF